MKKLHLPDKNILKGLIIVFITLLFCIGSWILLNIQISTLKQNYINSISNGNGFALNTLIESINSSNENASDAVELVKNAPTTGSRHWFILFENSILFERNDEYTKKISNMNFDDLQKFYARNGGTGIDTLFSLINKQENFSVVVLKDRTYGREIVNYQFVEINNETYCIGTGVIENYMFSLGKIGESIFYLRILDATFCLLILLLVSYHLYLNRNKNLQIAKLNNKIINNNILIQNNNNDLLASENTEPNATEDEVTGLYNRQFFNAIIKKLSERKLENIGVIVIKILDFKKIKSDKGQDFINNIINSVSLSLRKYADENDICSRIEKDEFSLIKISTTQKISDETASLIIKKLSSENPSVSFISKTSFKTQDKTLESIINEVTEIS